MQICFQLPLDANKIIKYTYTPYDEPKPRRIDLDGPSKSLNDRYPSFCHVRVEVAVLPCFCPDRLRCNGRTMSPPIDDDLSEPKLKVARAPPLSNVGLIDISDVEMRTA